MLLSVTAFVSVCNSGAAGTQKVMAPSKRTSRSKQSSKPPSSLAAPVLLGGGVLAGVAVYYGLPPAPVVLLAALVVAWTEPPPVIEGRDGQPHGASEHRSVQRSSAAARCRFGLLGLSTAVLPVPLTVPWVLAALVGVLAWGVPLHPNPEVLKALHGQWPVVRLRWLDAASAFLVAVVPVAAWRSTQPYPCNPVPLKSITKSVRRPLPLVGAAVGGASCAAAVVLASQYVSIADRPLEVAAAAAFGALGGFYAFWRRYELAGWRSAADAWMKWELIWLASGLKVAPRLVSHRSVGAGAIVDAFDVARGASVAEYVAKVDKITAEGGPNVRTVFLAAEAEVNGEPMPGSINPSRFEIVRWDVTSFPDLQSRSPETVGPEVVGLWARCAFQRALGSRGYGVPMLLSIEANEGAWESRWAWPNGPSLTEVRPLIGELADEFGAEVRIDHRSDVVYFGALDGHPEIESLRIEDTWNARWSSVLKTNANPPTPRPETRAERDAGGATIYQQGFVARLGDDPASYRGLEAKLASALDGARWVSVGAWPGRQPSERHPSAFFVRWSMAPIPASPAAVDNSEAASWILTGMVDRAFDAARLARPMVAKASLLTSTLPAVWRLKIWLQDGVTPGDVRSRLGRMAEVLSCPWVQIDGGSGGECDFYLGARPSEIDARSSEIALQLRGLEWGQAWYDAKVVGTAGALLRLTGHTRLESNESVEMLDFALNGVDPRTARSALPALGSNAGYSFLQVRPSPAGSLRLLASRDDPFPGVAALDFADAPSMDSVAFAVGVDGIPVRYDTDQNPHLLVAGLTGAGKSSCVAVIIYGFLAAGADLYVVDPVKAAVDFLWATPYTKSFGTTLPGAVSVLENVYSVVRGRVQENVAAAKAGLPPPQHSRIVVVVDEFTSLISQAKVGKASGDVELDTERDKLIESNAMRMVISRLTGQIAREARSARVTLLLATQKLTRDMLEVGGITDLKTNLARLLLGKPGLPDLQAALRSPFDVPPIPDEMPRGRGLWEPVTATASVVQVLYAPPSELAGQLATRREPQAHTEAVEEVTQDTAGPDDEVVKDVGTLELSWSDLDLEPETTLEDVPVATSGSEDPAVVAPTSSPPLDVQGAPPSPAPETPVVRTARPKIDWADELKWGNEPGDSGTADEWEFTGTPVLADAPTDDWEFDADG